MQIKTILKLLALSVFLTACGSSPSWDGYSPQEAERLQSMGLSAADADHYRKMGFNSQTIQRWFDAGIRDYRNVTAWHDAGFPAEEAGQWHSAGFGLQQAYDWRKKNFKAYEAQDWRDKGFDLKEAEKLRNKGLSAD